MFSGAKRMPVMRSVAAMVLVAFTLTLGYVRYPVKAEAATTRKVAISIAAIGIENLTKYELLGDDYGIDMLLAEVSSLEGLNIVAQKKVMDSLRGLEPNPDVAISVGRSVGADAALVGFVSNLHFQGKEQAVVDVGLSLYDPEDGQLLSEAVVQGRSSRLGFSGTMEELAELAIRDGVRTAMGYVFQNLTTFGVVTLLKGDIVYTNLAERDSVRPHAEIAIFKKDSKKQIATIEIEDVSIAHSVGKIVDHQAGVPVAVGDNVRVIYTPAVMETTATGEKRIPKKKKFSPLLMGALVVGVIAAVSRGGNKAEPPNPQTGPARVTSGDGKAAVSSGSQWNPNYVPSPPTKVKVDNVMSTSLASCWESNSLIEPLEETIYDFKLSTTPKDPMLPGSGYTIAFDIEDLYGEAPPSGYQDADVTNLSCATCNTSLGEWEILPGTYSKISYLNGNYGVACKASHFTPYVVVVDNRVDPIPATTAYLECGDQRATLTWDSITDPNNSAYVIWNCSQTSCSSIKETITDTSKTSVDYTLPNGSEVCYSVSGKSSLANQDATRSAIKCTTPSADPRACSQHSITLLEPENNITTSQDPEFIFLGAGDMDFYILKVWDVQTNTIMSTINIPGEGPPAEGATPERKQFTASYSGSESLVSGSQYRWNVTGWQNTGASIVSSPWNFTYQISGEDPADCITDGKPDLLEPANGVRLTDTNPNFIWKSVAGAAYYTVTVMDSSSIIVSSMGQTTSTNAAYQGTDLVDGNTYMWFVTAYDTCNAYVTGTPRTFIKQGDEDPLPLPVPNWADINPIQGGNQWVSLYWDRLEDDKVAGYAIYRSIDPDSPAKVATIYNTQMEQANNPCGGIYSASVPGYCDEGVTNGEKYYYWVAAVNAAGTPGDRSARQSVELILQRPILITPGDVVAKDITAANPDFRWFAVNGDDMSYMITVANDSTSVEVFNKTVTDTFVTYPESPALENGATYRWSVKAFNSRGVQSETSQIFRFIKKEAGTLPAKVLICDATNCPQQSDSSAVNYTRNSVTVYWQKPTSANIDYFNVYRCQDVPGICSTPVGMTFNTSCSTIWSNVVCFEDTGLDRGSTYYYNIEAVDKNAQKGPKSDTLAVVVQLKGPTLLYPIYQQYVYEAQPNLSWASEKGASEYIIQVQPGTPDTMTEPKNFIWSKEEAAATGNMSQSIQYNSDGTAKEGLANPSNPSAVNTPYLWRVCSVNQRNLFPVCSNPSKFFKVLKAPTVVSPESNQNLAVKEIVFRWSETPDAAGYTVRVCNTGGTIADKCSNESGQLPIVFEQNTASTSLTVDVSQWDKCNLADSSCTNGVYLWEVRAFDSANAVSSNWKYANGATFKLVFGEAPQLITPVNYETVGPLPNCVMTADFYDDVTYQYSVQFRWVDIGADSYILKIIDIDASSGATSEPPGSTNEVIIYEQEVTGTSIQMGPNGDCGATTGIPFMAGHKYRWNVSAFGTPFDDANAQEFYTGLPYPRLVAPLHGEPVLLKGDCDGAGAALCLHFDWDGGDYVDQDSGLTVTLPGVIGATSYDIEILKENTTPFLCEKFLPDSNIPVENMVPFRNTKNTYCDMATGDDGLSAVFGDMFTWRVRARDGSGIDMQVGEGDGIPGPWTQKRQFTVGISPVILAVPPDNSLLCDPWNDPAGVSDNCTSVTCQDTYFAWSPIPNIAGTPCFRIDVSDTPDFRNFIFTANSLSDPAGHFSCEKDQCYEAGTAAGEFIPMTNGVVYYWRVGSSYAPSGGGTCGFSWVYSDTWEFYKRPPVVQGLTGTPGITDMTVTWAPPVNCTSSTGQALSLPSVPPEDGQYLIYLDSSGTGTIADDAVPLTIVGASTTSVQISGLQADTDYTVCVKVADGSFYINNSGHISEPICIKGATLPDPNASGN